MNIHDYYAALSIGCKKHNLPSQLINEIFKFEVDSFRKKISYNYLEERLLAYKTSVIKRRKRNMLVTNNWLEQNGQYSVAEEFIFHTDEYPYQNINIEETACLIEKIVAKHNIDLQFSHYCCYVNHVDPAKGVVFMNYDRFYRGSLTGIESLP